MGLKHTRLISCDRDPFFSGVFVRNVWSTSLWIVFKGFFHFTRRESTNNFLSKNLHYQSHGIKDWYMLHLPSQQKPKGPPPNATPRNKALRDYWPFLSGCPHAPAGPMFVPCCAVQAAGRKEKQFFFGGGSSRKDEGCCFLYSIVITGIKILYIFVCECVV